MNNPLADDYVSDVLYYLAQAFRQPATQRWWAAQPASSHPIGLALHLVGYGRRYAGERRHKELAIREAHVPLEFICPKSGDLGEVTRAEVSEAPGFPDRVVRNIVRFPAAARISRFPVALANLDCRICLGTGVRRQSSVCRCVWRAVFDQAYMRYREAVSGGSCGEYAADFELAARRVLDAAHYRMFQVTFVRAVPFPASARELALDRGNYFHSVYRIKAAVGKEAYEARWPLWPFFRYERGERN